MQTEQEVAPVAQGYEYAFRLRVMGKSDPAFPAGSAMRQEVCDYSRAAAAAGELTTTNGGLVRINNEIIEVRLSGAVTDNLSNNTAPLHFVRTDLSPDVWNCVQVQLPVVVPTTKPEKAA